jgi:hypothetical protein
VRRLCFTAATASALKEVDFRYPVTCVPPSRGRAGGSHHRLRACGCTSCIPSPILATATVRASLAATKWDFGVGGSGGRRDSLGCDLCRDFLNYQLPSHDESRPGLSRKSRAADENETKRRTGLWAAGSVSGIRATFRSSWQNATVGESDSTISQYGNHGAPVASLGRGHNEDEKDWRAGPGEGIGLRWREGEVREKKMRPPCKR